MTPRRPTSVRRALTGSAVVILATIVVTEIALAVLRPEGGVFGLVGVLAGHIALAGLATAPVVLRLNSRRPRLALGALVVVSVLRFGGEWVSLPPGHTSEPLLRVASWNLEVGARAAAATVEVLRSMDADIVALQELDPHTADQIEADSAVRARFPYRALAPRADLAGMGLLSVHPIDMAELRLDPPHQDGWLLHPSGRVRILNAHPFPAALRPRVLGVPVGIDPASRNRELAWLRAAVASDVTRGLPVVLVGDFNTSPSEPAFTELTEGLLDAHAEVGQGPGWTWRPSRLEGLGLGLLRIDAVLSSPALRPVGTRIDCPPRGDHCILVAALAVKDSKDA